MDRWVSCDASLSGPSCSRCGERALEPEALTLRHFLAALISLWQFAYLAIAIRRFYLQAGRWGARLLSVAAAMLIYVLNSVLMTAVQVAGAAIAVALA
jgi:hypothetical protein